MTSSQQLLFRKLFTWTVLWKVWWSCHLLEAWQDYKEQMNRNDCSESKSWTLEAHLQPENAVKSFLMNSNGWCFAIICPRNSQNDLRTHAAEAECCWMLLNAGPSQPTPSAAPCMTFCWIISLTRDYVKYVSSKWAALCFGTSRLKANVPKQGAANLMEASNLNFWRTVPEDRHYRQSSLK